MNKINFNIQKYSNRTKYQLGIVVIIIIIDSGTTAQNHEIVVAAQALH